MIETDEQGQWEVDQRPNCTVRLLVHPSQLFLDWQASNPVSEPEDPDQARAEELLATSPNVITMPEIWELLRIFGRRHGYLPD